MNGLLFLPYVGDELPDKQIHDRDVEWLKKADSKYLPNDT